MPDPSHDTVVVPGKKSNKVPLILAVVVVLAGAGAGGFFWFRQHKNAPPIERPKAVTVMHLETFVVNLADEDQHTFLRVGIDLGVAAEEKKGKEAEAGASPSPVRDVILGVLMATHSTDVATVEGKQKLKELLLQKLRERQPQLQVQEIYFTEYLLQR